MFLFFVLIYLKMRWTVVSLTNSKPAASEQKCKSYHYVEVTVHHDGSPASEVNIFLPPVTYLENMTLFLLQACDHTKKIIGTKVLKYVYVEINSHNLMTTKILGSDIFVASLLLNL